MNIGDLYCYPATLRLELFEDAGSGSYIVDFIGLIEPKEPFVLLGLISLEDAFWRLYVLTTDGRMGWVTVQFIRYLEEVKSND